MRDHLENCIQIAIFLASDIYLYIWYHLPQRVLMKGLFLIFRLLWLLFWFNFWIFDFSFLYFARLSDSPFVFLTTSFSNKSFLLRLDLDIFRLECPFVWNGWNSLALFLDVSTFSIVELFMDILRSVSVGPISPIERIRSTNYLNGFSQRRVILRAKN